MGFLGFVDGVVVSGLATNNDQHWSRSAQVYELVPATYCVVFTISSLHRTRQKTRFLCNEEL